MIVTPPSRPPSRPFPSPLTCRIHSNSTSLSVSCSAFHCLSVRLWPSLSTVWHLLYRSWSLCLVSFAFLFAFRFVSFHLVSFPFLLWSAVCSHPDNNSHSTTSMISKPAPAEASDQPASTVDGRAQAASRSADGSRADKVTRCDAMLCYVV